ncbi:hypothetical protein L1887_39301 [Cichorium endivia]|nr:hypothetical protein L1887_39301 [Cichorium endivia]
MHNNITITIFVLGKLENDNDTISDDKYYNSWVGLLLSKETASGPCWKGSYAQPRWSGGGGSRADGEGGDGDGDGDGDGYHEDYLHNLHDEQCARGRSQND